MGKLTNKVVVEFGDDKLRNFAIGALRMRFRGTFSKAAWYTDERAQHLGEINSRIPDIPGHRLEIDCRRMKGRQYDPLSEEDHAPLLEKYNRIQQSTPGLSEVAATDDIPLEFSPDLLKTLLLEIVRMQDNGKVKIIAGSLPTKEEIEQSDGQEMFDSWNSAPSKRRYKNEPEPVEANQS